MMLGAVCIPLCVVCRDVCKMCCLMYGAEHCACNMVFGVVCYSYVKCVEDGGERD